jgi:hypothetical protein
LLITFSSCQVVLCNISTRLNWLHVPVQENQQMFKGVFIILIKLPRHVSASNWGAVNRILWMGVLWLMSWWGWQCNVETCRRYHT